MSCVYVLVTMVMMIPLVLGTGPCPYSCQCEWGVITCQHIQTFPQYLPKNLIRLVLVSANIPELPAGAFSGLPALTRITIQSSRIGVIRSCAFSHLRGVEVSITSSEIGDIESYAVNDMSHVEFQMSSSSVGVIHPYAFINISNGNYWDFNQLQIASVEPYAFYNITRLTSLHFIEVTFNEFKSRPMHELHEIESLLVVQSKLVWPHCQYLLELVRNVGYFGFYANQFYCDCRIEWFLKSGIMSAQARGDNVCYGPPEILSSGVGTKLEFLRIENLACENATIRGLICPEFVVPTDPDMKCVYSGPVLTEYERENGGVRSEPTKRPADSTNPGQDVQKNPHEQQTSENSPSGNNDRSQTTQCNNPSVSDQPPFIETSVHFKTAIPEFNATGSSHIFRKGNWSFPLNNDSKMENEADGMKGEASRSGERSSSDTDTGSSDETITVEYVQFVSITYNSGWGSTADDRRKEVFTALRDTLLNKMEEAFNDTDMP